MVEILSSGLAPSAILSVLHPQPRHMAVAASDGIERSEQADQQQSQFKRLVARLQEEFGLLQAADGGFRKAKHIAQPAAIEAQLFRRIQNRLGDNGPFGDGAGG